MSSNSTEIISSLIQSIFPGLDIMQIFLLIIASIFVLLTLIKFLRISGKAILKGDNLEVTMAFFFAFLGITGLARPSLILPFTLALLAVLSVAMLKNRSILEEIERKPAISQNVFIQAFDKEEVDRNIEQANQIIFLGTNLRSVTHDQYSRIEESLRKGNSIKILMINGSLCDLASKRNYEPTIGEEILKELNISIKRCRALYSMSKQTKGKLEIRLLDYLPPFGAIFIDPQEDLKGTLYLWFYTYRTRNTTKPKVILHARDGHWYQVFKEAIFALCKDAREYCEEEK
jgi:hypothetical protein